MPGHEATARGSATAKRSSAPPRKGAGSRPALRVVRQQLRSAPDLVRLARTDRILLVSSAGFLSVAGLVMVLSAGSVSAAQGYEGNSFWYFQRHLLYAVVGITGAVIVSRMPATVWRKAAIPVLAGSGLLMLIAAHPASGTSLYGASRWIDIGPLTLQPSEFAKLGLAAFAAVVLARKWRKIDEPAHLALPLGPIVVVFAVLGALQRDLGTTVILCGIVFAVLYVAGVRLRYLAIVAVAGLTFVVYMIVGEEYRATRFFESYLRPWADPKGDGYQLIQGLIAIGSGGWTGTGLGTSRAKWDFLPNAHSDFIFAVIGEELGLIGALVVLAAFALLVFAGVRVAMHAGTIFERLLAAGIIGWLGLQAIINLGAVTGILPITGVPLPFVSFGGTALVVTLVAVGVLVSITRSAGRSGAKEAASDRKGSR